MVPIIFNYISHQFPHQKHARIGWMGLDGFGWQVGNSTGFKHSQNKTKPFEKEKKWILQTFVMKKWRLLTSTSLGMIITCEFEHDANVTFCDVASFFKQPPPHWWHHRQWPPPPSMNTNDGPSPHKWQWWPTTTIDKWGWGPTSVTHR